MTASALDLGPLWDFRDPAGSERRLRAALDGARGDDVLVLRTQIARSPGLRRDFEGARRELQALVQFRLALALREREAGASAPATRVARWMVAHSLRRLGRLDEALGMQQALDRENEAASTPDPHVLDELVHLHQALGQAEAARTAEGRRRTLPR